MATKRYTNMNDVIEYLTNDDLSDLSELSEDEGNIDVMINQQTTSKQHDTAGSEDEEKISLAAHAASKPDVVASSLRKLTKNAYLDGENKIFHKLLMYFLAVY